LAVYRVFAAIPIPGINQEAAGLALSMSGEVSGGIDSTILVLDVFTGGGISTFSVLTVGIYGYLIARVLVNFTFALFPRLKRRLEIFPLSGRERLNQWTSYMSVVVTLPLAYGLLNLYRGRFALCLAGYLDAPPIQIGFTSAIGTITAILAITAGAKFSEWLADQISDHGVRGRGVWLIVAMNILAAIPKGVSRLWGDTQWRWVDLGVFTVSTGLAVLAIIYLLQARRNVTVMYPGRRVGNRMSMPMKGTLPLMPNTGGPQPILLAQGLILFPSILSLPFLCAANQGLRGFAGKVVQFFDFNNPWLWMLYFIVTVAFTYFYNDVFVAEQKYSESLRNSGARIPGVKPGQSTERYILRVTRRISLPAAVMLGLLVVLPFVVNWQVGSSVFLFTPVGLVMVVIAIRDGLTSLEADMLRLGYDGFLR
jgi:preprotein translocase subunit SecY